MANPNRPIIMLIDHAERKVDGRGEYLDIVTGTGEHYRVSDKRKPLWETFEHARKNEALIVVFETYRGVDYIASVQLIDDNLLRRAATNLALTITETRTDERNRSTALSYSKDLICADKATLNMLYDIAEGGFNFIKSGIKGENNVSKNS